MLAAGKVEKEGYCPCVKLLNLVPEHGARAVEEACERACGIAGSPSLKTVKVILKNMPARNEQRDAKEDYSLLRSEGYYGDEVAASDTCQENEADEEGLA